MNAPRRTAVARRAVHGVLLLDKPLGWTSNDALQKIKGLMRAEKGGHTGTLDPLATGLLPLCFGAATKFSQASLDADKRYRVEVRLGLTTTTGDGEGEVLQQRPVTCSDAQIATACAALTGAIAQVPPMHSALKKDGKALYTYARRGLEVERAPRQVVVHALDVVRRDGELLVLDVHCSKGTYVRTLATDLGEALGCGASLSGLRRTGCGALDVAQALSIEALQACTEAERDARLLPPDVLLNDQPQVRLTDDEAGRFLTGLRRRVDHADARLVRVYGPQTKAFLGSAHVQAGELIPERLLSPVEVAALLHS
jgi:tRNA pseudouridine55 synthase